MTAEEILGRVQAQFGDQIREGSVHGIEVRLVVAPEANLEVCRTLKEAFGFEYCNCVSGVDWKTHFDVAYHLSSLQHGTKVSMRVPVPRDDPHLRSVAGLWGGANWHEREVFDLFGVRFDGHPDHRRILLPEDWVGHPLRKDYQDERLVPYTPYA